jgi:hypothetical protein
MKKKSQEKKASRIEALLQFFKIYDIFGEKVELRYQGSTTVKSEFGGALSLVFIGLYLIYAYTKF